MRGKGYNVPGTLRWLLSSGKWVNRWSLFLWFVRLVSPLYFGRAAFRLKWHSRESYQRWCFSREVRDLVRRGQVERHWEGKPGGNNSLYRVRLTAKGRALLATTPQPYGLKRALKRIFAEE